MQLKANMVGRPKNVPDPTLRADLEAAFAASGVTASRLAKKLDRSPSTLLRSQESGEYSRELAAELRELMRNGWPTISLEAAIAASKYPYGDLQKLLDCLREMHKIMPTITNALEGVLDRRR